MTLPQYLESWGSGDRGGLLLALQDGSVTGSGSSITDEILAHIAHSTCQLFTETILQIVQLTPYSCRQLIADIGNTCKPIPDHMNV